MGIFFNKKRSERQERDVEAQSYVEVVDLKKKTHKSVEKTNQDIKKLNDLLKANGITLRIHIAAGGKRNGH